MRCSSCAAENPAANKFCGGCGSALFAKCPQCGAENTPSFKFCGECGAALSQQKAASSPAVPISIDHGQSSETPEGERKTVTALFADIKDSTELIRDLDPEEARAIVDPALRIMIDSVAPYGGYIVQTA